MLDAALKMPLKPSWRRYRHLFLGGSEISIYRALEYEALARKCYTGRTLDFGGGERAHYAGVLKSWIRSGVYESANISAEMEPTYLVRPGEGLPVPDGSFDTVVTINTLEHIYDLQGTLHELVRVLRPGGRLILAVPFLYRVHGCPDDYNRPTASWWAEYLPGIGIGNLRITPLVWDVMTSGLSITEGAGPFKRL